MKSKRPTLAQRVKALQTRKDRLFYELGLRDDLAQLIAVGMSRNPRISQRILTRLAGWKSESYVSRLINAGTNFKIGAAARVLVPLGIIPKLVDESEWERLRKIADSVERKITPVVRTVTTIGAVTHVPARRSENGRADDHVSNSNRIIAYANWSTGAVGRFGGYLTSSGTRHVHAEVLRGGDPGRKSRSVSNSNEYSASGQHDQNIL